MLAVNYTNLRDNMKSYMDQVTDDYETMIVTRKNNKNVVIMSEEAYNNLMENIHVMGRLHVLADSIIAISNNKHALMMQ